MQFSYVFLFNRFTFGEEIVDITHDIEPPPLEVILKHTFSIIILYYL